MAGFLRKKIKEQPQQKPVPSAPIPLVATATATPAVPPLFARFATTNKSENAVPLIVSSPKVLSSNVRKDLRQPTQTGGAKKRSSQNQVQSKPPPPRPLTPPNPILNKPLPPPSPPTSTADPLGSTPTQSFNKQTRPPHPSVFKNQPLPQVDSNSSFSSVQQTSNSSSASRRPSTSANNNNNNNSFTSPQKRNPTLSNNSPQQILPPIANNNNKKMSQQNNNPPPPPLAFGRQNVLPSTSAQTQLEQASSLANHQDLHPATIAVNNVMTKIGGGGAFSDAPQGTPVSDRNLDVDLPPEFAALFHNFNQQFNLEDRNSSAVSKFKDEDDEHVPASNVPRSPDERPLIKHDQHLLPPLPPPKSPTTTTTTESDMGVASSSHVIGNGLPSSTTKDFYSPRVVNGARIPPSSPSTPKMMVKRRHSPPPLPSVTSASSSTPLPLPKQQQQQQQDVLVKFPPRNINNNNNNEQQPPSNRTAAHRSSPHSPSSRKSSQQQVQQQGSPMVGKPRIFAMATQIVDDDELDHRHREETASSFSSGSPPPPYVQYNAAKKQQQQPPPQPQQQQRHHHHHNHHQPSAPDRKKVSTNGKLGSVVQAQAQQPLTPNSTPPPTPLKFPQNHHHHHNSNNNVELPPTPPSSHNRGGSRLSRNDEQRRHSQQQQQQQPLVNGGGGGGGGGGRKKDLKSNDADEEEELLVRRRRPQSQQPSPVVVGGKERSRKDSKTDEQQQQQQQRPQSQQNFLQMIRGRKNSKLVDEEQQHLPPRPPSQHIIPSSSQQQQRQSIGSSSRNSIRKDDSKLDEQQQQPPRTPSRSRKLSKARPEVNSQYSSSEVVLPDTPDSQHRQQQQQHRHRRSMSSIRTLMTRSRPTTPAGGSSTTTTTKQQGVAPLEPAIQLDEDTKSKAGILLDDDPFARMEGVTMLTTSPPPPLSSLGDNRNGEITLGEEGKEEGGGDGEEIVVLGGGSGSDVDEEEKKKLEIMKYPSISSLNSFSSSHVVQGVAVVGESDKSAVSPQQPQPQPQPLPPPPAAAAAKPTAMEGGVVVAPPTPVSPEEPRKSSATKKKRKKEKKEKRLDNDDSQRESTFEPVLDNSESAAMTTTMTTSASASASAATSSTTATAAEDDHDPEIEPEPEPEPEPILPAYTIIDFLSDPQLLSSLLSYFTFYDWCLLSSLSKEIRKLLVQSPVLRETVLERFLKRTVGYSRWIWDDADPLQLSLQDLNDYMRGVSTPTHEYARIAGMYVHSLTIHPNHRDPSLIDIVRILTASTRAYTRVVLRLRAQAEKEAILAQQSRGLGITMKRPEFNSSYYPPPSSSSSPGRSGFGFGIGGGGGGNHSRVSSRAPSPTTSNGAGSSSGGGGGMQETTTRNSSSMMMGGLLTFRSPLFRLRRAPLLRVFVPSPEGDWLSDKSVLACEEECRRAGVMHLIRLGDVVWDVAVGDEGNVGRLVWDGSYLIDLDYTYTSIGDLPKYIPALAFPPSYFHRVIRTGPIISNPIVHVDISPWGEEIAMNLQLLQDRVRTETPQGAYHNVVRWVHRSSFVIRPGPARFTATQQGGKTQFLIPRIPIPDTDNHLFVDSGWHGTVVVETEGTNEALADLQERCGPGVFPPRSSRGVPQMSRIQIENKKVFRVLREKSRPGEIWIKTVGIKERIM